MKKASTEFSERLSYVKPGPSFGGGLDGFLLSTDGGSFYSSAAGGSYGVDYYWVWDGE